MPAWLYEFLLSVVFIAYLPSALWRRRLPHRHWGMRLGSYPPATISALSGKPPIWVHAVSVGEVLSAQPLIAALVQAQPQAPLILSTVTPGGFDVAKKRFGKPVIPIYFPLDYRVCVRRALKQLKPKALILVESELWPVVIDEAHRNGVAVLVVNGRISARAYLRYQRVKGWMKPMLNTIDAYLMQSREDADRIIELGAPTARVQIMGSLKWDASAGTRPDGQRLKALSSRLGLTSGQALFVAGSTHRGEEGPLLKAFWRIRQKNSSARMIIAPRHLERLAEVERLITRSGLSAARLSAAGSNPWDVGLVDVFGQLPNYYGLASFVFIGGSLIPHGGQNPLEATGLGKPVIFGRFMDNFAVIAHQLLTHHAAYQVSSEEELLRVVERLVDNPSDAAALGLQAKEVTERYQGATQRAMSAILPYLDGDRAWPRGYG